MTLVTRHQLLGSTVAAAATVPALGQNAAAARPSLAGRSILIAGTSSGFGSLAATLFARSGAKVFAAMRSLPRPEEGPATNSARRAAQPHCPRA